jgi:hypothetical protein
MAATGRPDGFAALSARLGWQAASGVGVWPSGAANLMDSPACRNRGTSVTDDELRKLLAFTTPALVAGRP